MEEYNAPQTPEDGQLCGAQYVVELVKQALRQKMQPPFLKAMVEEYAGQLVAWRASESPEPDGQALLRKYLELQQIMVASHDPFSRVGPSIGVEAYPLGRMRGTWSHMFDKHEDGSKDHTYTGHVMVETATGVFVLRKDFVKKGIQASSDEQLEAEVKAWINQVYALLEDVQYAYPTDQQ